MGVSNGQWLMVNCQWLTSLPIDLATYHFAENALNEPLPFLLVIPNKREGSRRIGLASPVGRDLLRQSLRSCLGSAALRSE